MEKKPNRIPMLVLGSIVLLFAGILYAWSILKSPLATEFKWTAAQLSLNYTITICFFCIGGFVSGLLSKKIPIQFRLIAAAVLVAAGFILTSYLSATDIVLLYIAYGVLAGAGIGIVYNSVISATSAWFPDKKGLCSGILMMSFGISALIIGNITASIIFPSVGWRMTYVILGAAIGVVVLAAAFLIKYPPVSAVFPQAVKKGKASTSFETVDMTPVQMVKRPSFWMLFVFFVLLASVGSTAISFAKDFAMSVGAAESFAVTLVGVLSIFNGLGRIISGIIFDRAGLRPTQVTASAAVIAAPVLGLLACLTGSLPVGVLALSLCGFSYGFSPTLSASFSAVFYGTKNFPTNFSLMNLILIPASFTATAAGSLVTSTGSYVSTFVMLVAFSLVGLVLNLFIRKP